MTLYGAETCVEQMKRRRGCKSPACFAMMVIPGISYAMGRPAIALTNGFDTCDLKGYIHTENCYNDGDTFTCAQTEHINMEKCFIKTAPESAFSENGQEKARKGDSVSPHHE